MEKHLMTLSRRIIVFPLSLAFLPAIFVLAGPSYAALADTVGDHQIFFVNPSFDGSDRSSVTATLEVTGTHAYYYIDDAYLLSLGLAGRQQIDQLIAGLSNEFDTVIYPRDTAFWGSEPNPGIDGDPRITVLFEQLKGGTGGYFDNANGYLRLEAPHSNQREMLFLNANVLGQGRMKIFLAHEMQHLISFNQKELIQHVVEDTWLNELRSQYAITVVGYNNDFQNSDLQERTQAFVTNSADSLTEWPNTLADYATVTMFGEYLVEQYGPGIIQDAIMSRFIGIDSINEWLDQHHYTERFIDVFAHWQLANFINDTVSDVRNGYLNPNLVRIRVPVSDLQQLSYPATSSFHYPLKSWQPSWYQYRMDAAAPAGKTLTINWDDSGFSMQYVDNRGTVQMLANPTVVNNPGSIAWFMLMPINHIQTNNFGPSDPISVLPFTFTFGDQIEPTVAVGPMASPTVHDGSLIKVRGSSDIYVISGSYKRYLNPAILKLYGLNVRDAITVSDRVFWQYVASNYIRASNDKRVYTVWPDGTKHWLNIPASRFTASGRDWNSIFIVDPAEANFYRPGSQITR